MCRIPQLVSLGKPVLAVYGSQDPDFPNLGAESQELLNRFKADPSAASVATVQTVDGPGHYPQVERPDAVAQAIVDFLSMSCPSDPRG